MTEFCIVPKTEKVKREGKRRKEKETRGKSDVGRREEDIQNLIVIFDNEYLFAE